MLNGQLKQAYDLQHEVNAEYTTWVDISAHPADTIAPLPFLKGMEVYLPFQYQKIVANAGYKSAWSSTLSCTALPDQGPPKAGKIP